MALGALEHGFLRHQNGIRPGGSYGPGPYKLSGTQQPFRVGHHGANQEGTGLLAIGRGGEIEGAAIRDHGTVRQHHFDDKLTAWRELQVARCNVVAVLEGFVFRKAEVDVDRVHLRHRGQ
ncbi:hypothetical protein D3C84_335090 [compost metagenome]